MACNNANCPSVDKSPVGKGLGDRCRRFMALGRKHSHQWCWRSMMVNTSRQVTTLPFKHRERLGFLCVFQSTRCLPVVPGPLAASWQWTRIFLSAEYFWMHSDPGMWEVPLIHWNTIEKPMVLIFFPIPSTWTFLTGKPSHCLGGKPLEPYLPHRFKLKVQKMWLLMLVHLKLQKT